MVALSLFLALTLTRQDPSDGCALIGSLSDGDGMGTVLTGVSGNPGLDSGLTEDHAELMRLTGLKACVFLLQENDGVINAFATRTVDDEHVKARGANPEDYPNGTVYLGVSLINMLYEKNEDFGVPSVLAHEFAHICQFKKGLKYDKTMWTELHADFMAGWFTAHRSRFRQQNLLESWNAFFELGDNDFTSEGHHGTSEERAAAFTAGVQCNLRMTQPDYWGAFKEGETYVEALGAIRQKPSQMPIVWNQRRVS
jgi:hypothetical protein